MAVTAACSGLPAALLLLDVLPAAESNSSRRRSWAELGLRPLLRRLRQVPSLLSGPEPSAAQPWLLLCAAMAFTDGQLLCDDTCTELLALFRQPTTITALHTALLLLLLPPPGGCDGGGAAPAPGAADADMVRELQVYTVQLLGHVAAHSAALAEQCFSMLAPVMTRLLQLQGPPAAADQGTPGARGAGEPLVVPLWGQLLMKGSRGFSQALRLELQQRLPSVVSVLVTAGAACRVRPEEQDVQTWRTADADAVVVVQLAWAVQRGSDQPLVHHQQQHGGMPALAPADANALTQLLQAAAGAATLAAAAAAADGDENPAGAAALAGGVRPSGHMLLLTVWLLHLWAAQQEQQLEVGARSMARALAALLAHDSNDALALACSTAAAHLARLLLPRLEQEQHDLLLPALALVFERSGAAPQRVATWHMLTAGCRLLGDLAAAQHQQDTAAAAEAVPVRLFSTLAVSSEASSSSSRPRAARSTSARVTWQRLVTALRSLQDRLSTHKLERSASKEELVSTAEAVLEQLEQLAVAAE
jgi:hypothetical protein